MAALRNVGSEPPAAAAEPRAGLANALAAHQEYEASVAWGWGAMAMAANILSSVLIISVNKRLMGSQGYGFNFVVTLNAMHFLTTSVWSRVAPHLGLGKPPEPKSSGSGRPSVPLVELAVVVVISDLSIILLNSSLRINSLVIYQIAKLGVIPITCLAEAMLYGRVFTRPVIAAIAFTLLGVVLVSFGSERKAGSDGSDDDGQPIVGVFVALGSMFAAAAQQLSIRHLQLKHSVSSADLLSVVAPAQGISLLLVSAPVDYALTGAFISSFDFTTASTMCLASSCFSAVAVNVSQFMVLGKFSAVTYQLLGHAKTVLVLVAGWLFFNQSLTTQQMLGIAMAILGMAAYNNTSGKVPPVKLPTEESSSSRAEQGVRLLGAR